MIMLQPVRLANVTELSTSKLPEDRSKSRAWTIEPETVEKSSRVPVSVPFTVNTVPFSAKPCPAL